MGKGTKITEDLDLSKVLFFTSLEHTELDQVQSIGRYDRLMQILNTPLPLEDPAEKLEREQRAESVARWVYEKFQEFGVEVQTHTWDLFGGANVVEAYLPYQGYFACISTSIPKNSNIDVEEIEWSFDIKLNKGQFGQLIYIIHLSDFDESGWQKSKNIDAIALGLRKELSDEG